MLNNILQFIFCIASTALAFYLLVTLSATFFIFEWRLSVFDVSMWDEVQRVFYLLFVLSFGFLFFMSKISEKNWG